VIEPVAGRRRLAASYLVLAGGDALAKALSFVAYALVLSRRLGDGAYGALESALGTAFVASLIAEGGLAAYGTRALATAPDDGARLLAGLGALRMRLTAVSAGGLLTYAALADLPPTVATLTRWYALTLVPYAFLSEWFFQARHEPAWVAAPQVARATALLIGATALVRDVDDAWIVPVCDAAGFLVGAALQRALAGRRAGPPTADAPPLRIRDVFRASAPALTSGVFWALRMFGPVVAAGVLLAGDARDRFGAVHRLFISAHALVLFYFLNLLPGWARLARDHGAAALRRAAVRSAVGSVVAATGAIAVAELSARASGGDAASTGLRLLFGPRFAEAAPALRIAVACWLLTLLEGHLRFGLVAAGRLGLDALANAAGAVAAAAWLLFTQPDEPSGMAGVLAAGCVATAAAGVVASAWRSRPRA